MQNIKKKQLKPLFENALNLILISLLTGFFAGIVVTVYNILANVGEHGSQAIYAILREYPAFTPLLFLALAAGAIVIGTLVKLVPMIRGSGIPQIEGAARGIIRFKWYVTMCSMFAASLACIFLGLSAGAEGPSIELGGCAGDGVGRLLKRNQMSRRLQIAAGSSCGLAVAFNAPVTGLVFALEEAFRSFSPQVFVCSAISVVTGLATRNLMRLGFNLPIGFAFSTFDFAADYNAAFYGWLALACIICALCGAAYYYAVFAAKKLFKKITFLNGVGKYLIPFLLAGVFGLITVYAMGGGHSFIEALGTYGEGIISIKGIFGAGVLVSLIVIVVIRFITTVLATASGVPCGVFIPMLAIGAGIGAILSTAFQAAGMSGQYSDLLVIVAMSAFFTSVVKAPITGIIMVFELCGSFTNPLPALMGVAIGYIVGALCKTEAIYEKSLAQFIEEEELYKNVKKYRVEAEIMRNSIADGGIIRQIIWPTNGLVVEIIYPDGTHAVPDGEMTLSAGEKIIFECETDSEKELKEYLYSITGKPKQDNLTE